MDKSNGRSKFAKFLDDATVNVTKLYNKGKLKLEISSLNKTYEENINKINRKLLSYIEDGKIDASLFEPEYSNILLIKEKINNLESEYSNIEFEPVIPKSTSSESNTEKSAENKVNNENIENTSSNEPIEKNDEEKK